MAWIYGGASLADPYWVAGAMLWGGLIAKVALQAIRSASRRRSSWVLLALMLLTSRMGTHLIANLIQGPLANASNSYSWGPLWVAIPIGAWILAFRLAQPKVDPCLSLARSLAALNCLHAVWAMGLFPKELFRYVEPETRPGFETIILAVPAIALCGLLALFGLQISIGGRGRAEGWRAWISARLQLAVAILTLLVQMDLLDAAAFPSFHLPFPIGRFAIATALVLAFMAVRQARRKRSGVLPSMPDPAGRVAAIAGRPTK